MQEAIGVPVEKLTEVSAHSLETILLLLDSQALQGPFTPGWNPGTTTGSATTAH